MTTELPSWLWPKSNSLSPVYKKIWEIVRDEDGRINTMDGELLVDTNKIFPLLLTSQLPTEVLGFIWNLANQKYAGQLTEQELYVILALVALAQASCPFKSLEILNSIHTPPIPNLNLSFINPISLKSEAKVSDMMSDLSLSVHNKKQGSITPEKNFYSPDPLVKEIRLDDNQSSLEVNKNNIFNGRSKQNFHSHQEKRSDLLNQSDSFDEFSDFQSAPIMNSSNLTNLRDFKQDSAIGSRLANHNLGVKKVTEKPKKTVSTKSYNFTQPAMPTNLSSANKESKKQMSDNFSFLKNQTNVVVLKDTAIRENTTTITNPSINTYSNNVEKLSTSETFSTSKMLNSESQYIKHNESKPNESHQDLMSLQPVEDKYSALRELNNGQIVESNSSNLEPTSNNLSTDDFGDFVSADYLSISLNGDHGNSLESSNHSTNSSKDITSYEIIMPPIETIQDEINTLPYDNLVNKQVYSKYDTFYDPENITNPSKTTFNASSIPGSSQNIEQKIKIHRKDDHLNDNIHIIYWKWKQYMSSCISLLKISAKIFRKITSETILEEVLSSAQGYNYFCDLAEIAAVCRRINFSHREMNLNVVDFDDLMVDIDKIWSEMEPFYNNISIFTELPAWPFHPDDISCALCLTLITSGRVVYKDYNYHVTCANLWLHTVNSHLPALQYPVLYHEST